MKNKITFVIVFTVLACAFNSYSMRLPESSTEIARTVQPDGKTLVLSQGKEPYAWEVSRFNTDNSLDATFGADGRMGITSSFDDSFTPLSIETQPDGRILVKNIKRNGKGVEEKVQTRINSDGSLDPFDDGRIEASISMEKVP